MTKPIFLYSIKTHDGKRLRLEAEDAEHALSKSGLEPSQVRRFYPMCISGALPTEEDEARKEAREQEAGESLRQYQDELKRSKAELDKERAELPPVVEHLATGEVQILIPDAPARSIPQTPLRPRRPQNDRPLDLEMPAINASQGRLF